MKLKVLSPTYNNEVFLNEFNSYIGAKCDLDTSYYNFWDIDKNYDIIHLQWPEYLFRWNEPTELELYILKNTLTEWRKKSKIVVTRHNYHPHYRDTATFKKLYELIYDSADGIVHLGNYCLKEYKKRYQNLSIQNQQHAVISHPIFTSYPNKFDRAHSRSQLRISADAFVLLAFGRIKSAAEKNLILDVFSQIKEKNKILLLPGWKTAKGKEPINRVKWFFVKRNKRYRITNTFIPEDKVQYYFNAADLVVVPRKDTLNSGIPFLAVNFDVPIIGPECGNIKEVILEMKGNIFNPSNLESIKNTIKKASKRQAIQQYFMLKERWSPSAISQEIFNFYDRVYSCQNG